MTITIEQATNEDFPIVLEWTIKLYHHEDDGKLEVSECFRSNLEKWLSNLMHDNNNLILVAKENKKPCGLMISSIVINDNGFLKSPFKGSIDILWVSKEYRNRKIASMLLEQTELCFKSLGVPYIECNFVSHNQEAREYWKSNGFETVSETARKFI
ncbi:GNAT family N-acetyltransferase [Pleionea sediminis]|uniref:GNAT family N-acetyltransferase n=1 Tax=Pleionea sediminis TaxID=2569479 RepID=UPI001186397E|nr:N-acetyltransferase [Pleionea sediminis]